MNKIKLFLIIIFFFNLNNQVFGNFIEIKVKIDDDIITNLDIENETRYLFFLNPKLILLILFHYLHQVFLRN